MLLSQLRHQLTEMQTVAFRLPDGNMVPAHFHVTELGVQTKNFMECGGTIRSESRTILQLWTSMDFYHRLTADKFITIIDMATSRLGLDDLEVDVEFQGKTTLEVFSLVPGKGAYFQLSPKQTACLAQEACGIVEHAKADVVNLVKKASSCVTGGGCC